MKTLWQQKQTGFGMPLTQERPIKKQQTFA